MIKTPFTAIFNIVKITGLTSFCVFLLFFINIATGNSSEYSSMKGLEVVDNYVFKIPLDKYELKTRVAKLGTRSAVYSNTYKMGAEGGINGGFFCPDEKSYHRCGADNGTPNERIVNGQEYSKYPTDTGVRGIFGIDKNGKPLFVQNSKGFIEGYTRNTNANRRNDFKYGIANFPILLDEGFDPIAMGGYQNYMDDKKMTKPMKRAFICTTKKADIVYMGYVANKTITQMPKYLKDKYGCYFALNLDAGKSSAMVYHNKHLIGPGRKVTDGRAVIPKQSRIDYQLSNYKMTVKENRTVFVLYKVLSDILSKKGEKKKNEILHILDVFEKNKKIKANIPKRMMLRKLKEMLGGEYGFKKF